MATKKGYAPQVNTEGGDDYDDPDTYMMLVRPFKNKKIPYLQIILPIIAIALAIGALAKDEVSDGDWTFDDSIYWYDQFDEVDYDCGWQELRFTYYWSSGYESSEKFTYNSVLCDEDEDVFDEDWCSNMKSLGRVWLGFNIVGILLTFGSTIVVYKFGKASPAYFVMNFFAVICFLIAVGNWFKNEQCTDIENYSSDSYHVQTSAGTSMILIIVASGILMLALLVSSIHLIQRKRQNSQSGIELPPAAVQNVVPDVTQTAA